MKRIREILELLSEHRIHLVWNVFFNLLYTVFSVFSFASVVPFLKILFNTGDIELPAKAPVFSLGSEQLIAWSNYRINHLMVTYGKETTLMYFCAFIVLVFLLKNLMRYLATYHVAAIRVGVVAGLRQKIHDKILKLPLSYFTEERKGNLLTKITSDVSEVEWSILGSLEMLFRDPIMFVFFLGSLILMNWQLTLFVLVVLPISALIIGLISKNLKGSAKKGQGKLEEVLSTVEESISGLRIIKGFNAEKTTADKFNRYNNDYFRLMVKLYRRQYLGSPVSEVMGAISMAIIMLFGGMMIINGEGAFDGAFFITFIVFFSQLITPAKSFSGAYFRLKKGVASLDRIKDLLHADISIHESPDARPIKAFNRQIVFSGVHFSYDGQKQVLKDINLEINKGEMVALVGQSGGGKSTLVDLIPRFYDIQRGYLTIDETEVRNLKLADLRRLMGIVSQESVLFNDTVFNNIALGNPDATEEEVQRAAQIANAHGFISALEQGYHTNIGERGGKLSGGQRQRLSIARAVLKNPPILILDEATSALDTESEKLVQDALEKLMHNRTSLVIAHRLSTIQNANLIVVLKEGKIVERGKHAELLEKNGAYKKLYDLQDFG